MEKMFEKINDIEEKKKKIVGFLAQMEKADELERYLYGILKYPYIVLDPMFRVLGHGNLNSDEDNILHVIRGDGYMTSHMMMNLCQAMGHDVMPDEYNGRVCIDGKEFTLMFYVSRQRGLIMSIIIAIREEGSFDQEDVHQIKEISDIYCISQRMLWGNDILRKEYEESFVRNLLDGQYLNHEELNDEFNRTKIKRKKYIYVVATTYRKFLEKADRNTNMLAIRYHLTYFQNFFLNSSTVVMNNRSLVTIVSTDDDMYAFEGHLYGLAAFLEKEDMVLCCSNGVKDIRDISLAYKQTQKCMQLLNLDTLKHSRIKMYYKFALRHMYQLVSVEQELINFCHPAVTILMEYDKEHGTEYLRTLFVYLKNSQQLNKTSEELHVHRNTLAKRLEKLESLIFIDMQNGTEMAHLIVSLEMLYNGYTSLEV